MRSTPQNQRLPTMSLVIAGVAVTFTAVWSIIQWPAMSPEIVTRAAAGNHGSSVVSRGLTAVAMPLLIAVMAALLAFAPKIDAKLRRIVDLAPPPPGRGSVRVLGVTLVSLSLLLSVIHVLIVGLHTGTALPFERILGVGVGVTIVIIGCYLPLAKPNTVQTNPQAEAFRAALGPAYRIGAFVLVAVGFATVLTAVTHTELAVVVGPGGILITFATVIVLTLRTMRNNGPRDSTKVTRPSS